MKISDLSNKESLLQKIKCSPNQFTSYLNEQHENVLHLRSVAKEEAFKQSQAICGNIDMTLYQIIECLILSSKNLPFRQEKFQGSTPLHCAFKTGNLETALWIMQIVRKDQGIESYNELINSMDHDGMRPIDLLAFKIDDYHKQFIKDFHGEEKNYKLSKQFDAYSWGCSYDFQLGYTQLSNERKHPKKIQFQRKENEEGFSAPVSIKDVRLSRSYSIALSEDGRVFTWGQGMNGHLGQGDESAQIAPLEVKFDFKDEEKRVRKFKKNQMDQEEAEEMMIAHKFVTNATKGAKNARNQAFMEEDFLLSRFDQPDEKGNSFKNSQKMGSRHGKKTFGMMGNAHQGNHDQQVGIDSQLALLRVEKVQVARIACSNKHSLIATNTGAIFAWGENDFEQLGFKSRKATSSISVNFESKPRQVTQLNKQFIIDVACGDGHSCAISSQQELYVWGCNKEGQLGLDIENYPVVSKATKLVMYEYMNSSKREKFLSVKARTNYTAVTCDSKNIYISDKNSNHFTPLFAKQGNGIKKLEGTVYLADDYLLAMDTSKSIYYQKVFALSQNKNQQDKKVANEIFSNSNFIDLQPTDKHIWAVNSLRQILVCKDFKGKSELTFTPANEIFNVMKAFIGNKHQVVIKIVKQLDELMIRDISIPHEASFEEEEDFFIPVPSICQMDLGISISGSTSNPRQEQHIEDEVVETNFIPSLADIALNLVSQNITLENALDLFQYADMQILDELKINCLKFISLNIVSYLETTFFEKLASLPVYLLRELENFIKLQDLEKYTSFSMKAIENAEHIQSQKMQQQQTPVKEKLTQSNLKAKFMHIEELFERYVETDRLSDQYRQELVLEAYKMRQNLRKQHKKLRKGSSNVVKEDYYSEEPEGDDFESIVESLELINDFIKSNIQEEINDYQKSLVEQESSEKVVQTVIRKQKKKKVSQQKDVAPFKEVIPVTAPKSVDQQMKGEEGYETFFLRLQDEKEQQRKEFEKHSLENDFFIVKPSDKKPSKVVNISKSTQAKAKIQDEEFRLCDYIDLGGQKPNLKRPQKSDSRPSADIWNYISDKSDQIATQEAPRERIVSLEEIQREEMARKTVNRRKPKKMIIVSNGDEKIIKEEEDSKNAWGMNQDQDEISFQNVMIEESKRKEEQALQRRRDEELVQKLQEEDLISFCQWFDNYQRKQGSRKRRCYREPLEKALPSNIQQVSKA